MNNELKNAVLNNALRLQIKYHPDVLSRRLIRDGEDGVFVVDLHAIGSDVGEYQNLIRHLYGSQNVKGSSDCLTVYFSLCDQQLLAGLYDIEQRRMLSRKILVGGESATPYICGKNSECYKRLQKLTYFH